MRKIYLTLKADVIVTVPDDETRINEIMEQLFIASDDRDFVEVEDSVITDYNVTDSK